jgi:hypothetical protein
MQEVSKQFAIFLLGALEGEFEFLIFDDINLES